MFHRIVNTPQSNNFFLFGARSTGKSTLLASRYPDAVVIDLLDASEERDFSLHPERLRERIPTRAEGNSREHNPRIIIDEIQKCPKLLDEVHRLIEDKSLPCQFILTGSSARKLKLGGANLLAGRAAVRNLFPLLPAEIGDGFALDQALRWGLLPKVVTSTEDQIKRDYLVAYGTTYLKEEIWAEQLVRKLDPFRRFLEVAAQQSGKIINANKISRDVGADPKTVQTYFQILEDTLLGFHLDAYNSSIRKRLRQAPKFYFVDNGIARSLARMLNVVPEPSTSYYGELFESFVVAALYARDSYVQNDYRMSYLESLGGAEIDLVIERPGRSLALVEIKSTDAVREDHCTGLKHFQSDFPDADFFCVSRDPREKRFGSIKAIHWQRALEVI
jgi:predicted AAA+ superfamily ATPase